MNNSRLHEDEVTRQFDLPRRYEDRYEEPIKEISQYFLWAITHPEKFTKLLTGRKKENR